MLNPYIFGGGGGGWTPNDLASIWAWYEADSYALADGAGVSTDWIDQSPNGRDAQVNGAFMTYQTAEIGGQDVVEPLGGVSYFQLPDMSALTEASIYMVLELLDVTLSGSNKLHSNAFASHYPFGGDGLIYDGTFRSARINSLTSQITLLNTPHLLHIWSAANDWGMKQGNLTVHTTASNTVAMSTTPTILHNGSQQMRAQVGGVYICSAKLSGPDDTLIRTYINAKYGVTV